MDWYQGMDHEVMVGEAREFTRRSHQGQKRKYNDGDVDYFVHPERVAEEARRLGMTPQAVIAAYLHDVVEDTSVSPDEIRARFGPEVADMVLFLTNPSKKFPKLPRADRKRMDREHLSSVPDDVKILKALDRIDNLRETHDAPPDFRSLYAKESLLLADALGQGTPSPRLSGLLSALREEANRLLASK